jgi:hypothetical protein
MIEETRQGITVAGVSKACPHLELAVAVVEAAADAAEDSRPGTTQPILIGGNSHYATDQ